MQLTIADVDYAPEDLSSQTPIVAELIKELPGPDRPDYWLAELSRPIHWSAGQPREITHLILAARWVGTRIAPGARHLPVGIAYVIDPTVLADARLDLKKVKYVAIGMANETTGGRAPESLKSILSGRIQALFGVGKAS
jgi:hypothetical protein